MDHSILMRGAPLNLDRAPAGISQFHREAGTVPWPHAKAPKARAEEEDRGEISNVSPDI
jgi:hypothetical protein